MPSLMIRHFPSISHQDPLPSLPSQTTLALSIRWIKHKWQYLILRLSMHAFNSTSFICTSTSYTLGLCPAHVTRELPTIEDSLGLPILDEVECGPDIFLSHVELLIIPLLLPFKTISRPCTSYLLSRPNSLLCKPAVGPLLRVVYILPKLLAPECISAIPRLSKPLHSFPSWCISALVEVAPSILTHLQFPSSTVVL